MTSTTSLAGTTDSTRHRRDLFGTTTTVSISCWVHRSLSIDVQALFPKRKQLQGRKLADGRKFLHTVYKKENGVLGEILLLESQKEVEQTLMVGYPTFGALRLLARMLAIGLALGLYHLVIGVKNPALVTCGQRQYDTMSGHADTYKP
jgi:hypothetical protein